MARKLGVTSLDFALEAFPVEARLRDGTPCTVRPLARTDTARLHKFFLAVSEPERLFYKSQVTQREVINEWCRSAGRTDDLTLLLLHKGMVAGQATLQQQSGGWKRHIGMVTTLTHPKYRGRGVVRQLVGELIPLARHLGLKRLEAELNGERATAIRSFEQLGFAPLLRIPDYLQDMQCRPHDYVLLGMDLLTDEEYASAG